MPHLRPGLAQFPPVQGTSCLPPKSPSRHMMSRFQHSAQTAAQVSRLLRGVRHKPQVATYIHVQPEFPHNTFVPCSKAHSQTARDDWPSVSSKHGVIRLQPLSAVADWSHNRGLFFIEHFRACNIQQAQNLHDRSLQSSRPSILDLDRYSYPKSRNTYTEKALSANPWQKPCPRNFA